MFIKVETNGSVCTFYEEHNNENRVEIKPGHATVNQIKSIAYQLLAMVGE
jgi:hypothetical protein